MSDAGWEPVLSIDVRRRFGEVCVPGTRIPAATIAGTIAAGDAVDFIADGYEIPAETVRLCCWWHVTDLASRRPTKWGRRIVDAWHDWALRAGRIWGGFETGSVGDPPSLESQP